jgi:hypothetical protein
MAGNGWPAVESGKFHICPDIAMFGGLTRILWFFLLVITLVSETAPLPLSFEAKFPPLFFYGYEAVKLAAFVCLGFLTPLAWWHYKSLGNAAMFAFVVTGFVEMGQSFIPGHRPSTLELFVKFVLLFAGFVTGLDVRKYQVLSIGWFTIHFSSRYWKEHILSKAEYPSAPFNIFMPAHSGLLPSGSNRTSHPITWPELITVHSA